MTVNQVYFQNDGEIDMRAVRTFGVSVKTGQNPIGFFGTGLKYAIAILLRTGHRVEIWEGTTRHEIGRLPVSIRGESFEIVTLDDEELGMTLDVGKSWELWMALRELYSNTLDEGGEAGTGEVYPQAGKTTIKVIGAPFFQEYANLGQIFLFGTPVHRGSNVDIYERSSSVLFYRGVRVLTLRKRSALTYNLTGTHSLTEDRTLMYGDLLARDTIRDELASLEDPTLLRKALLTPGSYETLLDFIDAPRCSDEFVNFARRHQHDQSLVPSARSVYERSVRRSAGDLYVESEITAPQKKTWELGKTLAERAGVVLDRYPIRVAEALGPGVMGVADRMREEIWIARSTISEGHRRVASTLLEEYLHLAHGLEDESRGMQNFLLDLLLSKVDELPDVPF